MKKLALLIMIIALAVIAMMDGACTEHQTRPRPSDIYHIRNQYERELFNKLDAYCQAAENPDNIKWHELVSLDDSIWMYLDVPGVYDSISGSAIDFVQHQEYLIDSIYGWTDHYSQTYREAAGINYWRFKE